VFTPASLLAGSPRRSIGKGDLRRLICPSIFQAVIGSVSKGGLLCSSPVFSPADQRILLTLFYRESRAEASYAKVQVTLSGERAEIANPGEAEAFGTCRSTPNGRVERVWPARVEGLQPSQSRLSPMMEVREPLLDLFGVIERAAIPMACRSRRDARPACPGV